MKSLLKMTLIGGAIVFALAGCDKEKMVETPPFPPTDMEETPLSPPTDMEEAPFSPSTDMEEAPFSPPTDNSNQEMKKEAYAVGASFGNYLRNDIEKSKISLDTDLVIKGFEEAFRDKSQYNQEQIQYILGEFSKRLQTEAQKRFETEKAASLAAGDKYREEFAAQEGVKQTESGLLYRIINEGTGEYPTADDTVIVHYTGTLVDGQKFDSSYDRGDATKFPLKGVIKGWTEGIQLIGVSGKIELVVPPELAYGDQERPTIPVGSTLVFEVELLGIDDNSTNQAE